jgi:hypothetical protein
MSGVREIGQGQATLRAKPGIEMDAYACAAPGPWRA